ncbi:hypothetical protein UFOVP523_50 [uncultured Caudovirales phage]|jgi:hypothetical protein|uniref:Uncharacterized protein n=1 Tax=uncultured Caudovirales phage TaxID=2100421 RepID=A0A6J5MZL6_9CAUD|nr:hypothetical protein UFOVP523_50 [uncultured Caudovirales phage]
MEAKEKAKELIFIFSMDNTSEGYRNGVKGAYYCIREIINICRNGDKLAMKYWTEVKKEIEKLF